MGRHSDEFFGAIGRIVCVSAVLEDKVTTLRHTLANAEQGRYTRQNVSSQIKTARIVARDRPEPAAETIAAYLDKVEAAFRRRNDLVHSSFPAQPDGRIWGHRPTRDKDVTDGTADTVETTIDDLRQFIQTLSGLVNSFNQVHALAGVRISPSGG